MAESTNNGKAPVIIDLGKKNRKAVKRLRKGQGSLMDDVHSAIDELQSAKAIGDNVQLVIVTVEARPKKSMWTSWM